MVGTAVVLALFGGFIWATRDAGRGLAHQATVTASSTAFGFSARDLVDTGSGVSSGAVWRSENETTGAWVDLSWSRTHVVRDIAIVRGPATEAGVTAGFLAFGDGSYLQIQLSDSSLTTIVHFSPRTVDSIRFTATGFAPGSRYAELAELVVNGNTGATAIGAAEHGDAAMDAAITAGSGPDGHDPRVLRDGNRGVGASWPAGDPTGSWVQFTWPEPQELASVEIVGGAQSTMILRSGTIVFGDGAQLPVGAVLSDPERPTILGFMPRVTSSVRLTVDGVDGSGPLALSAVRVYHQGATPSRPTPPAPAPPTAPGRAAGGRTLVYAEEFNHPVSMSRTGLAADYAAAKPVHNGAEDFGDAIFADPAQGFDNVRVEDGNLRIDVKPVPPGYPDPQGWGRTHFGGLLASARTGGSGFSAQYGYFEARMLAPAAPGTWPAFWMLPSDNLVAPTPTVAEIDAVELYGHDPLGACHSTHEYKDGKDNGVAQCGGRFDDNSAALSWHTYGVSITPTENIFSIDGRIVATAPQVDGGGAPMFFLVDLALGGGWPVDLGAVQDRAAFYVDYVRVYV